MYLLNILRRYKNLFNDPKDHLLRVEINKQRLEDNISFLKQVFPHHALAGVLKSNAYGHGLRTMGRLLEENSSIEYFCVDSLVEARILRDNGNKKPIIILGYIPNKLIKTIKNLGDVILVINSISQADYISKNINFSLKVHIKVDTGMNRQGIGIYEIDDIVNILKTNKKICVDGLMSHLADADNASGVSTNEQIKKWKIAQEEFEKFYSGGMYHFSATAGTRHVLSAHSNLIRIGIGMYGFDTTADKRLSVLPILSFYAKVVNIKKLSKGESVGYNFTYTADKDRVIGVVPCGYYEGLPRNLSNKGVFYYKDTELPILGRISMNLTVVDVTKVADSLKLEDEIEIYSNDSSKKNSIENIAKICDTIPYEILVRINGAIRRFIK